MLPANFAKLRSDRNPGTCYNVSLSFIVIKARAMTLAAQPPLFLFLDDDAFRADRVRDPEIYYPLIGAHDVLALMSRFEVVKAISVESAQEIIQERGCPHFISFDNDLQRPLEGIHLAHWLVEQDLDRPGFIPFDFRFFVHSQNPIAKARICSYLDQYLQTRAEPDAFSSPSA